MAKSKKVTINLFPEGELEITTADIEDVTPFCNYSHPDTRCATTHSKVLAKEGKAYRTLHSVEDVKLLIKEAGGRLRGRN
jgi:hypothetical protein